MAKKKKGGYLNRKTDPIASSSKTAGPATPAFCDGCGGGCGGCGDCERCNFGIVCEKCGGTGRAPVAAIPVVPEPSELEFADQFSSGTFTVVVGPSKKEYMLHKVLLSARSQYFATLLSFPGKEGTEGRVTLEEEVDTDEAFRMFIEFAYLDDYVPPETPVDKLGLVHAQVYVLAERLCMNDLKALSLNKAVNVLSALVRKPSPTCPNGYNEYQHSPSNYCCSCAHFKNNANMELSGDDFKTLVKYVDVVYRNTPDRYCIPEGEKSEPDTTVDDGSVGDGGNEAGWQAPEKPKVHTPTYSDATEPGPKDRMRTLISRFCASVLDKVKNLPEFREVVRGYPEFAEDLMTEAGNGTEVKNDELSRL